jgi:hypothetical protein
MNGRLYTDREGRFCFDPDGSLLGLPSTRGAVRRMVWRPAGNSPRRGFDLEATRRWRR